MRTIKGLALVSILSFMFVGCSSNQVKIKELSKTKQGMLENESSYMRSLNPAYKNAKLYKKVTGSFYKTPAYNAVYKIANDYLEVIKK